LSSRNPKSAPAAHLGANLRRARQACHKTQTALAEELGVSQQTVSYWERGLRRPDNRTWVLLRQCLGYTRAELEGAAPLTPLDSRVAEGPASRREVRLPLIQKGTAAVRMDLADQLVSEAMDVGQAQRTLREALRAKRPVWIVLG